MIQSLMEEVTVRRPDWLSVHDIVREEDQWMYDTSAKACQLVDNTAAILEPELATAVAMTHR